jgi:transcription-repair coupling factor (superfamily II helicase)
MRDLEIRGAGNLLGAAQSGQIHAVGLDLYSQLLQEAVREVAQQGQDGSPQEAPEPELPRIELPLSASIPESYIDHLPTRMDIYQRLARLRDRQQVPALREELRDRFGPLPEAVENLLLVADLRALAAPLDIESISQSGDAIVLVLRNPVGGARVPLQRALGPSVNVGNKQIQVSRRRLGDQWLKRLAQILGRLQVFQERLRRF